MDPSLLINGPNTLAAEVHQVSVDSEDMSFDLELVGSTGQVSPRLFIEQATGNNHVLRWPSAAGFRLQSSADLISQAKWQDYPGLPTDDGTWKTLTIPSSDAARFYRLIQ